MHSAPTTSCSEKLAHIDTLSFPYTSAYRAIFPARHHRPLVAPARIGPIALLSLPFPRREADITLREIRLRNAHPFIFLPGLRRSYTAFSRGCFTAAMLSSSAAVPPSCQSFFSRRYFSGRCFHRARAHGPERGAAGKNSLAPVIHRASTSCNTPP